MPYKRVIFDFDGTLADSVGWVVDAFDGLAQRHGFRRASRAELEALRGLGSREIMKALDVPFWKLPMIARHMQHLQAQAADRLVLFPGIAALLTRLHEQGVRVGIASSNSQDNIRKIIGPQAISAIKDFECGAAMFGKARRLKRMLALGTVPASQSIYIGDETRDIEAAREAGIDAGAVLWGVANRAAFDGVKPTAIYASVAEMAQALAP